jgi:uncharacterized damage-inducible protein DinB
MNSAFNFSQTLRLIPRPWPEEYAPASEKYIRLVPENPSVLEQLQHNAAFICNLYLSLPASKLPYQYGEGKWTLKQVLVHLADDERIYAYRALCFARNDPNRLWGFDQDMYIEQAQADQRDLHNILEEYVAVRQATIALYNGFPEEALTRIGHTTEYHASVRALLYHIAGHEINHLRIIQEKYLD